MPPLFGRSPKPAGEAGPPAPEPGPPAPAVRAERRQSLLLLRTADDNAPAEQDIAELARSLGTGDGVVTVVPAPLAAAHPDFWPCLGAQLDILCAAGTERIRLVLAGSGGQATGRTPLARRIADSWDLVVEAPDGAAIIVPGGSLFIQDSSETRAGWRRFAPGQRPRSLGLRCPEPDWQAALARAIDGADDGWGVEQIPAGVQIRNHHTVAPTDDLCHAIPMDPQHLTVVVAQPEGEPSVATVAGFLARLPAPVRQAARIAPGGSHDLLRFAQEVADRLGEEVELCTGPPLLTSGGAESRIAAHSVVLGPDGTPAWTPLVDAVACRPSRGRAGANSGPELLRWTQPFPSAAPGTSPAEPGTGPIGGGWQAAVTRSGLRIERAGTPRVPRPDPHVRPEGPVIEVGTAGGQLDDSLWPALAGLLDRLPADSRRRAVLHVLGAAPGADGELRQLSTQYGIQILPVPGPVESTPPLPRPPAEVPAKPDDDGPTAAAVEPVTDTVPVQLPIVDPESAWEAILGSRTDAPGSAASVDTARQAPHQPPAHGASVEAPADTPGPAPVGATQREPAVPPVPFTALLPAASAGAPQEARDSVRGHPSHRAPATPPPSARQASGRFADLGALLGDAWEPLLAATQEWRSNRLPTAAPGGPEALAAELAAVAFHLGVARGATTPEELSRRLRDDPGDPDLASYAACLSAGLRRLPTYRGVVLRGAGPFQDGIATAEAQGLRVGAVLRDAAALSCVPLEGGLVPPRGPHYAILSVTARSPRGVLAGRPDHSEVVFAPSTPFRVLAVRPVGSSPAVLLRELPVIGRSATPTRLPGGGTELDDADLPALARLDEALERNAGRGGPGAWPDRCAGPVGAGP